MEVSDRMNGADSQKAEKIPGPDPAPDTPTSEARAAGTDVDVLVIGGGIQGAGAAQAAAAAGFKVALLERREAAIGTSSRSSKLIHGGLRYLESYQFSLVRESLAERQTLLQIAPHLVRLVPFHIPVYRDTRRSPLTIRAGLSLYAALGNLRRSAPVRSAASPPVGRGSTGSRPTACGPSSDIRNGQTDDAALWPGGAGLRR